MIRQKIAYFTAAAWISLMLTGCSTTKQTKSLYPAGSLTMAQIYDSTTDSKTLAATSKDDSQNTTVKSSYSASKGVYYTGYTRTADNEVSNLFKPLPNPRIPVYIYPHLAQEGEDVLPVPGYTTVFWLYPHEEYAMPQELV